MSEMRDLTDESLTEQLSRERLLDMEARLGLVRKQAFGVLALALIAAGPWIGFEFLLVLAAALAAFSFADRRMHRSRRPERWAAFGWALAPLVIAGSAAVSGGPESPALMWLGLPVVTLGARFEPLQAATTAPPRRGSPPPWSAPDAGSRSTAWQPPKNRLRSRNQATVRPLASSATASIPGSA